MSNQKAKQGNTSEATHGTIPVTAEALEEQQAENGGCTFYQFLKIDPATFEGSSDTLEAESWMKKMDDLLSLLDCTNEQKVSYASFLLNGDADHWWEFTKRYIKQHMTWDLFKDAFLGHYIPRLFRCQKANEFMQLKQGNMTVAQYTTKFIGLLHFVQAYKGSLALEKAPESMVESRKEQRAENRGCTFYWFMKINPPAFKGSYDRLEAESWIKKIDNLLSLLDCTDVPKVSYTTFMLKGDADHWWELSKRDINEPVTWELFKDAFLEYYFPGFFRDGKVVEFWQLEQGNMTVAEYNTKFIELSRFAPSVIDDKGCLARHFRKGLKPSIRSEHSFLEVEDYRELVDKALMVESYLKEFKKQ